VNVCGLTRLECALKTIHFSGMQCHLEEKTAKLGVVAKSANERDD
jgi:hypothetical protein